MSVEVGQIVEGKVTGLTNFGAFISLEGGQTGLVHISEVADKYVKSVNEYLKEGDTVKVKVLSLDKGKIGLSIRQAQPKTERPASAGSSRPRSNNGNFGGSRGQAQPRQVSFEDKLAKFIKDSDERLSDLRKNTDSKRGGRGGGRVPSNNV